MILTSCNNQDSSLDLPDIQTIKISDITSESAVSGGEILNAGNVNILQKGICWSLEPNPTIDNQLTQEGSGNSNFSSLMTNLNSSTVYHVRSYIQSELGIKYGNEIEFSTLARCRLKSIETPNHSTYEEIICQYNAFDQVSSMIYNFSNGYVLTEDYEYLNNKTVKIIENGERIAYEFNFNEDILGGYVKYYASGSMDINEIYYLGDTAIAFVLIKPFGTDNSLIPIDSTIFIFNEDRNIKQLIRYHEKTGSDPYPMKLIGTETFIFDNSINPYKRLLTNFSVQNSFWDFARYFNNNNFTTVLIEDQVYREWDIVIDENSGKTSMISDKTTNEIWNFNYENCN